MGPIADQVAGDIRARMASPRALASPDAPDAARVLEALGGAGNIARVEVAPGRVLVTVKDGAKLDLPRLRSMLPRGIAVPKPGSVHLLHADAQSLAAGLGSRPDSTR